MEPNESNVKWLVSAFLLGLDGWLVVALIIIHWLHGK